MIDDALAALERGATVLTATRRLARELTRRYDTQRVNLGDLAWQSPDVLPLEAWIRRSWDRSLPAQQNHLMVLNNLQLEALWISLIEQDIAQHATDEQILWNLPASARAAIRSLRLLREWDIQPATLGHSTHPDHASFRRWFKQYTQVCQSRSWIDEFALVERLISNIEFVNEIEQNEICLAGFDQLTTRQDQLVQALIRSGLTVSQLEPASVNHQDYPCTAYPDADTQWRAAASWARQQLSERPDGRVAIVVPDLGLARLPLERALRETLHPRASVEFVESRQLPWHLSLGQPLIDHPLARGSVELLETVTRGNIDQAQAAALVLSPWIHGYQAELSSRGQLALTLRRELAWQDKLSKLLTLCSQSGCVELCNRLQQAVTLLGTAPVQAGPGYWSEIFSQALQVLGWPGEAGSLDSDNFQAYQAIREQLAQLGSLELISPRMSAGSVLAQFRRSLSARMFQFESGEARVEVLDIRESAGLEFDGIWFGDLLEDRWPVTSIPDPFIPVAVQRAAGISQSDIMLAANVAERAQQRLAASAPHFMQSYPLVDADIDLTRSPLLADCETSNDLDTSGDTLYKVLHDQRPAVNSLTDESGTTLAPGPVQGGTGLVQQQSLCPRGAYLRFRLNAREVDTNQPGLDPARRGSLVHRVLENIWAELGDSKSLGRAIGSTLDNLISREVKRATTPFVDISGCGQAFFATQHQWLRNTLAEWFQLERDRREPFKVLQLEQQVSLTLAGLGLQFKIDRIDQFEDGSLALIDYKTSGGQSIGDWMRQRPNQPQLPLYYLSQLDLPDGNSVSAIGFGVVKLGNCKLDGITNREQFSLGSKAIHMTALEGRRIVDNPISHWDQLDPLWRRSMGTIATEFAAGDARINPDRYGICSDCPTPSFCRSAGLPEETDDDDPHQPGND